MTRTRFTIATLMVVTLLFAFGYGIFLNYRSGKELARELNYQKGISSIHSSFREMDVRQSEFDQSGEWCDNKISVLMRLRAKYEQLDNHRVANVYLEIMNVGAPSDEIEVSFESLELICESGGMTIEPTRFEAWTKPVWGMLKIPTYSSITLATIDAFRTHEATGNCALIGDQLFQVQGDVPMTFSGTVRWDAGEYFADVQLRPLVLFPDKRTGE
ncbi:MAG: hypothetical protein AAFX06_14690 [Planctomycetota bacterium]